MSLDNVLPMSLERFVTYVPERFKSNSERTLSDCLVSAQC